MADDHQSGAEALAVLLRDLATLKRESGAKLVQLAALPRGRGKSQLGQVFRGEVALPPDRDVVEALVTYMLDLAERTGRSVTGPATVGGWLSRYDEVMTRWDAGRFDPGPEQPRTLTVPNDARSTPGFVGRADEFRELDNLLEAALDTGAHFVAITALAGTAGVGKTALANEWASSVRHRFPDGIFLIDLHGYHHTDRLEPTIVAGQFLRELGLKRKEIPADLRDRMQMLDKLLRDRSVLVIYDNVGDSAHVAPLLLKQPTCFTIITSRDSLDELVRTEAVARIELDQLTLDEALDLLRIHLHRSVVASQAELVELAKACVRLPLALRIAAETLNKFPARPVAELLAELHVNRLDPFDAPRDADQALRSVFSWSYRYLDPAESRMFRAVGLHPGPDSVDRYAMAAMQHLPVGSAGRLLDQLARSYLVVAVEGRRYTMHDLLRSYAAERADAEEPARARRTMLDRLARYQLYTTAAAMNVLAPYESSRRPRVARPRGIELHELAEPTAARAWMKAERRNLLASARISMARRSSEFASMLSGLVFRFLDSEALYDEALALHGHAVQALRGRPDASESLGLALRNLGMTLERLGRNEEAADRLTESLQYVTPDSESAAYVLSSLGLVLYRIGRNHEAADVLAEAVELTQHLHHGQLLSTALRNLAFVHWRLGRYEKASEAIARAADLARRSGDDTLLAFTLTNLGLTLHRAGRTDEALACQEEALQVAERGEAQVVRGYAMTNRGLIRWRLGRFAEALADQEQAFLWSSSINHQSLRAYVQMNLGLACWKTGDLQRALRLLQDAYAGAVRIGDLGVATEASNSLGEVALDAGSSDVARRSHQDALDRAVRTGDLAEQARAYEGLARCAQARGRNDENREITARAIKIWEQLADARAVELRTAVCGSELERATGIEPA